MAKTAHAFDGYATAKRGNREQEILTPRVIVDVSHMVWPEGIALDPCAAHGSLVGAKTNYYGTRVPKPTAKQPERCIWKGQGLVLPWKTRTYINPPFDDLLAWLIKALAESRRHSEQLFLGPVRTRRPWWREHAERFTRLALLDPLPFHGYELDFPESLFLGYRGSRTAAFEDAIERTGIGELYTLRRTHARRRELCA